MALCSASAKAAVIEGPHLFPDASFPSRSVLDKLWAESNFWATGALNRVVSMANPRKSPPYEIQYGGGGCWHCSFCRA